MVQVANPITRPVAAVRRHEMYRRVLVPLDGSTVAMQVLPYTAHLAKAAGAKLELMQVISPYPRELVRELTRENLKGQPRATPLYE